MKAIACRKAAFAALAALLTVSFAALGQELVPTKEPEEKKKDQGWDFLLTPALSTALASNYKVVGQPEGASVSIGANVDAGAAMRYDVHEWRNTLKITEQWTRTPVLDEFTKSTDIFKLESIYLFHLIDWLGPFAQLNLDATLIESFAVQPEMSTWQITYQDGSSATARWLHNMARTLPPMMQVMKDIGGVEIPETLAKLAGMDTEPASAEPSASNAAPAPVSAAP